MKMYLLITLFICHWVADYTHLSRPYMLAAKRFGKPYMPIFEHASIHAALVLITIFIYTPAWNKIIACTMIMLITHFVIDVWKGKMNVWFPKLQNPSNVFHWYVFGLDQLLHTIVILIICQYAE